MKSAEVAMQGARRARIIGVGPLGTVLSVLAFTIPFGAWQEASLAGWTVPQLAVPLLAALLLFMRPNRLRNHPQTGALAGFAFLALISSIANATTSWPVLVNIVGYLVLCVVTVNVVRSVEVMEKVLTAYFVGISLVSILAILALTKSLDVGAWFGIPMVEDVFGLRRLLGTEVNPNAFAVFYIPAIPLGVYFYLTAGNAWGRGRVALILFAFAVCLVLTVSRGALLGVLSGLLVLFYYLSSLRRTRLILFGVAVLGLGAVLGLPGFVAREIGGLTDAGIVAENLTRDKDAAVELRYQIYAPATTSIIDHPFFGVGLGNFKKVAQASGLEIGAHSMVLGIATELGIIAATVFVFIVGRGVMGLRKSILQSEDLLVRRLAAVVLAGFAGLLVNGLFHEGYVHILLWLLLGLSGSGPFEVSTRRSRRRGGSHESPAPGMAR